MSNLTPEKRMDKNGRLVTKHVKTGVSNGLSMASVPAPSLPEAKKQLDPLSLLAPMRTSLSQSGIKMCSKFLKGCKESTLAAATDAMDSEKTFTSAIMSMVTTKMNEGFLLLAASASREWSSVAEYNMGDKNYLKSADTITMVGKLWDAYSSMTNYNTTSLYKYLSDASAEDFNQDESVESFRLEYLGQQLELDTHTRTKQGYYKALSVLNSDIDGVVDAMPVLLGINKNLIVMDRNGYEVGDTLKANEIMSVVQMTKEFPERIGSLVDFIKERHTFNEEAARAFLQTDTTALSSGIL